MPTDKTISANVGKHPNDGAPSDPLNDTRNPNHHRIGGLRVSDKATRQEAFYQKVLAGLRAAEARHAMALVETRRLGREVERLRSLAHDLRQPSQESVIQTSPQSRDHGGDQPAASETSQFGMDEIAEAISLCRRDGLQDSEDYANRILRHLRDHGLVLRHG